MRRPPASDEAPTIATSARRAPARTEPALRVEVVAGPDRGLASAGAQRVLLVGRAPTADVRLSDRTVSSFHAELCAVAGGVGVRDLESTNGTFHQGARLGSAVVPDGAVVQAGGTSLRVGLDAGAAAAAPTLESFGELRGASRVMRELFGLLARLARTEMSVLLEGPTGAGKELAARAVHEHSAHARGPFVVLDCTAIPATLAESMLFGHERGAFTGAAESRPGVFEAAEDGTIFLDEVGELGPELQPKLLRALERREVVRVGATRARPVRARVVSATWRDLRGAVNQGRFREDLYYRLAQARVVVPPLRDRPEDVPLLARWFLDQLPPGVVARSIAPEALDELGRRDWPGNVRELRHAVERAAFVAAGEVILPSDLAFERMLAGESTRAAAWREAPGARDPAAPLPRFKEAKRTLVDEFERDYLQGLLARAGRNLTRASALAGVERHHLRDLLRKHGLRGEE